jgi:hypothetical protein
MSYRKREFHANVFVPLDILCIPRWPLMLHVDVFSHIPNFDGIPCLASSNIEYFMNYIINTNIFYEEILMKTFAYSMQGENAWD